MDLVCSICDRPLRDVSDRYLPLVRETVRGRIVDAIFFCGRNCRSCWVVVEGEFEPCPRSMVADLPD